jgi:hypothetical protein
MAAEGGLTGMEEDVVTLAQRPDLADQPDQLFDGTWPEFVLGGPVDPLIEALTTVVHTHLTLDAVDGATGKPRPHCPSAGPATRSTSSRPAGTTRSCFGRRATG